MSPGQPVSPLGSAQSSCGLLHFSSPISFLLAHRPVCLFPLLLPLQKRSLEIKASYSGPALSPVSAGQPTPQPLDLGGFQASMSWSTVACWVRGPVE